MRARGGGNGAVPDRLMTFDADVWPSWEAWHAAREAWNDQHGWPGRFGWEAALVDAAAQIPDEPWTPPVEDHRPPRAGSEAV